MPKQLGQYAYYEIEDAWQSEGCKLCHNRSQWRENLFPNKEDIRLDCSKCILFSMIYLCKEYAKQLEDYDRMYIDDGK